MFGVLKVIIIVVTALVVFGWTMVAADPVATQTEIVLEAMPEIPSQARKKQKPVRPYRTPFIVPISPPAFGKPWTMPPATASHNSVQRPDDPLATHHFTTIELPDFTPALATRGQSRNLDTHQPWASHIVDRSPPSRTVSVVRPNSKLLAQRVATHNLSLKALRDHLKNREAWTLEDLDAVLRQLHGLQQTEQLLHLYWRLLEPREQWRVGSIQSLGETIELFRQRLFEVQVALDVRPISVTSLDEQQASNLLTKLQDRLSELAASRLVDATSNN